MYAEILTNGDGLVPLLDNPKVSDNSYSSIRDENYTSSENYMVDNVLYQPGVGKDVYYSEISTNDGLVTPMVDHHTHDEFSSINPGNSTTTFDTVMVENTLYQSSNANDFYYSEILTNTDGLITAKVDQHHTRQNTSSIPDNPDDFPSPEDGNFTPTSEKEMVAPVNVLCQSINDKDTLLFGDID